METMCEPKDIDPLAAGCATRSDLVSVLRSSDVSALQKLMGLQRFAFMYF